MFRYGPAFHHGPGVFAWVFLALLVALVALGVVALVRMWAGDRGRILARPFAPPFAPHHAPPVDPALGELRLRYARGEIDRDEYARRAGDLGYPLPPGAASTPPPMPPDAPTAG